MFCVIVVCICLRLFAAVIKYLSTSAALFEDEPYDEKNQNLMQTYIYALKKSLKNAGAEAALIHTYNAFAVNPEVLDCDYYRFKQLDAGAVNAYSNEYMSQYS